MRRTIRNSFGRRIALGRPKLEKVDAIEQEIAEIEAEGPQSERMVDANESRRLAREQPFADSLPPYSGFFTTRGGTLWVVDAIAPSDTGWSATAFRQDGAIVGRLEVAGRSRPLAFADDRVAIRTEDEDGVVGIRVHLLRPVGRP